MSAGGSATGLVLEVTSGRIPCRTFASWLGRTGWVKRFTEQAAPGAYLRVIEPGEIRAGDPIEIVHRPDHEVTVALAFRAVTIERELLPQVLAAGDALHPVLHRKAREYVARNAITSGVSRNALTGVMAAGPGAYQQEAEQRCSGADRGRAGRSRCRVRAAR